MFLQFLFQFNFHPYTLNKPRSLVVTAESTDRVDNSVHLPERHTIHHLVEVVAILF